MKRFLFAALLALFVVPAHAQIVTKSAPPLAAYPYNTSGIYYGIGALGQGAIANIAGANAVALGAALNGVVGYQWRGGLDFMAVEASAYWTNLGASASCPLGTSCSVDSNVGLEQRFKLGFPYTAVSNLLPNFGAVFPGLPVISVQTTGTQHPYLMAGVHEDDVSSQFGLSTGRAWQVQPVFGAGILGQWTQGLVVDMWAEASISNVGFDLVNGGLVTGKANIGTVYRAGVSALF